MIVGVLVLLSLIGFRPLARWFTRRTGTRVVAPADVAYELNRRFPMEHQNELYFTMVYGVLNIITQEVRYVSAGHPPMIQSSGWQPPEMLAAEGFMVGVMDGIDFEERRVQLKSGDRLYLYSDGLVEQFNTADDMKMKTATDFNTEIKAYKAATK